MQRAVDWYSNILGFQIVWRAPDDGDGANCMLQAGTVNVLLSTGSSLGSEPRFSGTLYFDMDDVEALYDSIKDKVDILWPLETQESGLREFGVRDRDGYSLAFSQEV
jgi:uncharacterized glyoxalase superfamily protein PhnB